MKRYLVILSIVLPFFIISAISAQDAANQPSAEKSDPMAVLSTELGYREAPGMMMQRYLQARIDHKKTEWKKRYEAIKTEEDARKYQQEQIDYFHSTLGAFPDRGPLHAQVTKTMKKDGYRVEAILLETAPKFYLTGLLFLPDSKRWPAPYPAMLVTCGHTSDGKGFDSYQKVCVLAAMHGVAAFLIDPIDQGERSQFLKKDGARYTHTVPAHNLCQFGCIPLGRNTATFMVQDMIRSVDYLQEREDVDPNRIGVAGNSGGGTQASYLMALDPRISVAAPACYLCSLYGDLVRNDQPQDGEQNIFGQLGFGLDHADYVLMRAPRATLIGSATKDFFPIQDTWESFRYSKRFYDRFNASESVSLIETDQPHGWSKHLREATVRWMVRWFYGRNENIVEPENLVVLSKDESCCTEQKEVLKIDGAKSVYDLNREYETVLAEKRKELWADGLTDSMMRRISDKIAARRLAEIPEPKIEAKGKTSITISDGMEVDLEKWVLEPEPGILLPILRLIPKHVGERDGNDGHFPTAKPILYLHGKGKSAGFAAVSDASAEESEFQTIDEFLRQGRTVIAADIRGLGETQFTGTKYYAHDHFGTDGQTYCMAYLLGLSYVGMRTEDVLSLGRWIRSEFSGGIELYAFGLPGTVAIHAAVLEPTLFDIITVEGSLASWSHFVDVGLGSYEITEMIHGSLLLYDIPDLVKSLGNKLTFQKPVNAQGRPLGTPIALPGW